MQQVAMRGVQFDQPGAGGFGTARRCCKSLNNPADLGRAQRLRGLIAFSKWQRAGSKDGSPSPLSRCDGLTAVPGLIGTGFSAGMGQLDARHRTLFGDEREGAAQRFYMSIRPYAEILRADAAIGRYRGSLGDYGRRSTNSAAS